ncbi:MAG: hypothetical protein ACOX8E_11485, partial [Ruminococcus sp.]
VKHGKNSGFELTVDRLPFSLRPFTHRYKTSFSLAQEISPFITICFSLKSRCCVMNECESIEISKQCRDLTNSRKKCRLQK